MNEEHEEKEKKKKIAAKSQRQKDRNILYLFDMLNEYMFFM